MRLEDRTDNAILSQSSLAKSSHTVAFRSKDSESTYLIELFRFVLLNQIPACLLVSQTFRF